MGGKGTRLYPISQIQPKPLIPIANKPIIQYAIENLRSIGINEIIIVIGNTFREKVENTINIKKNDGLKFTYIIQEKPKGIAHAIRLTKKIIGNEKFVVILGDNILENDLIKYKNKFENDSYDASILLYDVEDPSRFGIAEIKNDEIIRIVEKPKKPITNHAVSHQKFLR